MISSALRTTTGSFSCHSLFFLVAGLWASLTTLIKHMACNRVRGMHKREKKWGWGGDEKNPKPENLLNDGTSHGLVALAVPSPSHALVRPWPWAWHLRNESVKPKPNRPRHSFFLFFFLFLSLTHTHTPKHWHTQHTRTIWEEEMDRNNWVACLSVGGSFTSYIHNTVAVLTRSLYLSTITITITWGYVCLFDGQLLLLLIQLTCLAILSSFHNL